MVNFSLEDIAGKLTNVSDLTFREIRYKDEIVTIVYIETLCDSRLISDLVIGPLLSYDKDLGNIEAIRTEAIMLNPAKEVKDEADALNHLMSGDVLIFFPFLKEVIFCHAKGFPKRSINEPTTEVVIKGPREGFVEDIYDNISSIRRRLKTPDLKIESFILGSKSQTSAAILFIEGTAPDKLVTYVRDKINSVNKDYVLYTNYLEERMKCKGTPFDTIGYTEKPDTAAQKISEGRVIIFLDGSANAAIAPYFFIENFQTTDDYTMNKFMANTGRALRLLSFIIATLVPGMFLALVTHHFKLIPTIFLFKMAVFRAGVPLPTILELITMLTFFQIIREAGVRLPQPIGSTLSIVGALILGDAAVNSGLASQVTVVVVGIASICSYLVPKLYISIFIWNSILVIFSGFLGLPGFYVGFTLMVAHLANLTTCGYPYLYPLGTKGVFKYRDVTFRGDLSRISNNIFAKDDEK